MAGDWIKMRGDLSEDPAVINMATCLGLDEFGVVGRLHNLWAWLDRQSRDGHATGVTTTWINRRLQCDGFAEAMEAVGWLVITSTGISLPNFDRHNGETAKTRALGTKRKQKERDVTQDVTPMSRTERDKSETREEKRREEESNTTTTTTTAREPTSIEVFPMEPEWGPSTQFETLAKLAGLPVNDDAFVKAGTGEFIAYWLTQPATARSQIEWDNALVKSLKRDHVRANAAGPGRVQGRKSSHTGFDMTDYSAGVNADGTLA